MDKKTILLVGHDTDINYFINIKTELRLQGEYYCRMQFVEPPYQPFDGTDAADRIEDADIIYIVNPRSLNDDDNRFLKRYAGKLAKKEVMYMTGHGINKPLTEANIEFNKTKLNDTMHNIIYHP
jgi:hypothetical protein